MINSSSEHIKVPGYRGYWYVIETAHVRGFKDSKLYLLEHETYGDETESLIVTNNPENGNVQLVMDDVWNGFDDYIEQMLYGDEFLLVIE